jgi:hypothetical protein
MSVDQKQPKGYRKAWNGSHRAPNVRVWRVGQIVYCQGQWACRVVKDFGDRVDYVALEGHSSTYLGNTLTASKDLFSETKDSQWGKRAKNTQL